MEIEFYLEEKTRLYVLLSLKTQTTTETPLQHRYIGNKDCYINWHNTQGQAAKTPLVMEQY